MAQASDATFTASLPPDKLPEQTMHSTPPRDVLALKKPALQTQSALLVDWIRNHLNATEVGGQAVINSISPDIEKWLEKHLNVTKAGLQDKLDQVAIFVLKTD